VTPEELKQWVELTLDAICEQCERPFWRCECWPCALEPHVREEDVFEQGVRWLEERGDTCGARLSVVLSYAAFLRVETKRR
jgi:hypothetical protein